MFVNKAISVLCLVISNGAELVASAARSFATPGVRRPGGMENGVASSLLPVMRALLGCDSSVEQHGDEESQRPSMIRGGAAGGRWLEVIRPFLNILVLCNVRWGGLFMII